MTPKEQRVQALLARSIDWPCPVTAVEAIALEEDCRLKAYLDTIGVPTCGWGETEGVALGMVWTQSYADERLRLALFEWTQTIKGLLKDSSTTSNQLSAMLCLSYNVGLGAFKNSTVLRCHLKGDHAGASRAFGLFNKTRDPKTKKLVVSSALTARRARECALYLTVDVTESEEPPPLTVQEVAPESSLGASPIMQAGGASVAVGALLGSDGLIQQIAPAAATVGQIAQTFGVTPFTMLSIGLVGFGGVAMYYRWKQRSGGWV